MEEECAPGPPCRSQRGSENLFDSPDDPLLSRIFNSLGFDEACLGRSSGASISGVCKRWRRVLKEVQWTEIDLSERTRSENFPAFAGRALERLAADEEINVSAVKSFSIDLENNGNQVPFDEDEEDDEKREKQWAESELLAAKTCANLVSFLARAAAKGWPLESFKIVTSEYSMPTGEGSELDGQYLERVLAALGSRGPLKLQRLEIRSSYVVSNLRRVLAPFRLLRTLRLGAAGTASTKMARRIALSAEDAAVIARCLLDLRLLSTSFDSHCDAVGHLASLEHLEELEIRAWWLEEDLTASRSFEALAAGPAGRSLKRLSIGGDERFAQPCIGVRSLRAIGHLRALENLYFWMNEADVKGDVEAGVEGMRALGALPELRTLGVVLENVVLFPHLLSALADAVRRAPKLQKLSFSCSNLNINPGSVEHLGFQAAMDLMNRPTPDLTPLIAAAREVLSAAAGRPGVLRSWRVSLMAWGGPLAATKLKTPPLTVADAELLAACAPSLSCIYVQHSIQEAADLAPLRILRAAFAGLSPKVQSMCSLSVVPAALPGVLPDLLEILRQPSGLRVSGNVGSGYEHPFSDSPAGLAQLAGAAAGGSS